jgi:hypothetical protein
MDSRQRRSKLAEMNVRMPFARAVENFRQQALARPDYDPARLFVWAQMQATCVVEMLKEVEARLGEEGQRACIDALERVGRRVAEESLAEAQVPDDLSPLEMGSLWCTWINEVLYASVEEPCIEGEDAFSFDILYCPHQDTYSADDCRVQRYLVQGMGQGSAGKLRAGVVGGDLNAAFTKIMPAGAPTCHFRVWRRKRDEEPDAWRQYSDRLAERALRRTPPKE